MLKNREVAQFLEPQATQGSCTAVVTRRSITELATILTSLEHLVTPEAAERVREFRSILDKFAVRISIIGQVKAGKTALTNALIGRPGLLPSDVNPWTSVITSVHINTEQPQGKNAVFTFYKTEDWNKMINVGGHLGEMASRANYLDELQNLKNEIEEMQKRAKARLGKNFELLLDGSHSFLGFSPKLIRKYVCLGDDEQDDEGRYAEVTKSAQIYISNETYILPTVLCDTPGVNDPFLLREAVTLSNLSDTDICVIVLTAHQAFTAMDIGLLRILTSLKHEQLVLFVNRIDELEDPDNQISEIDTYIRTLLKEQDLQTDIPVIFGSAAWAEVASAGSTDMLDDIASRKLVKFALTRSARIKKITTALPTKLKLGSTENNNSKMSDLSGLFELQHVLQESASQAVLIPMLKGICAETIDIVRQSELYFHTLSQSIPEKLIKANPAKVFDDLDTMIQKADEECIQVANQLSEQVLSAMSSAFETFLNEEVASLAVHLKQKKDIKSWQANTIKLRRDLNAAHNRFVIFAPQRIEIIFDELSENINSQYTKLFGVGAGIISVYRPQLVGPRTPVSLMRTMAIDMSTGWFASWLQAKFDQEAHIKKLKAITLAEMESTLADMQKVYVVDYVYLIRKQLYDFLAGHVHSLQGLLNLDDDKHRVEVLQKLEFSTELEGRITKLGEIAARLDYLFAEQDRLDRRTATTAA